MKSGKSSITRALLFGCIAALAGVASSAKTAVRTTQEQATQKKRGGARPVTIPVGVKIKGPRSEEELRPLDLNLTEDGEAQTILSIRAVGTNSPITMAILIQDDLVSSTSLEIKPIGEFIRQLPKGSRVMVGYIRSGSLDVRQKFTIDLDRAAAALRIPIGSANAAPFNPYVEVLEALGRFESQPTGRRAILLVSDGLDSSRGIDSSSPAQSLDLQRAINQAQRRSVAVYSVYVPSVALAATNNQFLIGNAQSSLGRLSSETGGISLYQGNGAPVSFNPFLAELSGSLERQFALTYLSTHSNRGFHKIQIRSLTLGVELTYPAGHTR